MIIVGAKGFAKEVLEIFNQLNETKGIAFYDDVTKNLPKKLYDQFSILTNIRDVENYFSETGDCRFALGLGGPKNRLMLARKMQEIGGSLISSISPFAKIGSYDVIIGSGSNVMTGTVITNSIRVGDGCLINLNCTIGHDTVLGRFVELSPGVHVSGNCNIGDFCNLGTNSTILPGVNLGRNVIVGAGAVVTKDVSDNTLVTGIPAVVKRILDPIDEDQ